MLIPLGSPRVSSLNCSNDELEPVLISKKADLSPMSRKFLKNIKIDDRKTKDFTFATVSGCKEDEGHPNDKKRDLIETANSS